jgi:predicted DNA-binding ribbon-helix-helix protein
MKSSIVKHSIVVADHKTSVSLEDEFWSALKEIAAQRHMTVSALVTSITADRQYANLSSVIRVFVLNAYCDQVAAYDQIMKDSKQTLVA